MCFLRKTGLHSDLCQKCQSTGWRAESLRVLKSCSHAKPLQPTRSSSVHSFEAIRSNLGPYKRLFLPHHMTAKTAIAMPGQPIQKHGKKKAAASTKAAAVNKATKAYARKNVTKIFAGTSVQDNTDHFPKFEKSELVMGKLLGKGGFGTVMEIRGFKVAGVSMRKSGKKGDADAMAPGGTENKKFIAEHCLRNGGDARYAVKFLSPEVVADTARFIQGMQDMAIEQRFLSDIEHTNIVKMRASSTVDPYDSGFFIIMDRLYDTMEQRLVKWKARKNKSTGLAGKLGDRKGTKAQSLMEDRLVAAFDLSSAFEYLHGRRIVYRDIKPDNIGFDCRGE